jgi:hypothetical protein
VAIVNDVVVAPAATVTLSGTVKTLVFDDERLTTSPPVGAGPASVTFPVVEAPPGSDVAEALRALSETGRTVSEAVFDVPPKVAVNVVTADALT